MKSLTRENTITETYGYEAYDGTFFTSESECVQYESTAKSVVGQMYKKLVVASGAAHDLFVDGDCDSQLDVVCCKTVEDLTIVNQHIINQCGVGNNPILDTSVLGNMIIILWGYLHDWCDVYSSFEDIIATMYKNYNKLIGKDMNQS